MLTSPSQAFLYFPGGFGTLDEFFEVLDNTQLGKMPKVPIGCFDSDYWDGLKFFLEQSTIKEISALTYKELNNFKIISTSKEALDMIEPTVERPLFKESDSGILTHEAANWRIFRIMSELVEGFDFVSKIKNDVTILGTNSIQPSSPYYEAAYNLAYKLGKNDYAVLTGGGRGIMEAANKGAYDAGGESIGLNLRFNHQVRMNSFVKDSIGFYFPFVRKLIITAPSLAFVIFPGSYGTLHQLFELLTLMQTGKMGRMPVILFGKKYWQPLDEFLKKSLAQKFKTIDPHDTKLYQIVDKVEDAYKIIKTVPKNFKK
jgi:hypothetical protein